MTTPYARQPPPDLTPAPAVLKALAHVAEVDLASGLGRQRMAEVTRSAGASASSWRSTLLVAVALLAAAGVALFLTLR
jgi:hypothetical protein